MPAILGLVSLFGIPLGSEPQLHPAAKATKQEKSASNSIDDVPKRALRAHGIRLLQLTDRDSSVMTVSQVDEYSRHDPLVNTFRTVGQLHNVAVSGEVAVMPETRFAEALISKSSSMSSDLLLVPWSETGSIGDAQVLSSANVKEKLAVSYTNFVKSILQSTEHNIAILFTKSNSNNTPPNNQSLERAKLTRLYSFSAMHREFPTLPISNKSYHIFFPYFGGDDDKFALTLVLQLCEKTDVTATIVHISAPTEDGASPTPDDYFGFVSTHIPAEIASRVKFDTTPVGNTVEAVLERAASELGKESRDTSRYNLFVLGRGAEVKSAEGKAPQRASDEVKECLGIMAGQLVESELQADVLVVRAKTSVAK